MAHLSPACKTQSSLLLPPGELLEHLSDAVIATDLEFRVTAFNHAAEQLYGISKQTIIGRPLGDFIRYTFYGTTTEKALQQLQKKGRWQGKVSFKKTTGNAIELLANVSYIRDRKRKRIGLVAVNKNITVLEEAQRQSKSLELRMKSILKGTTESLFLLDSQGKLLLMNDNAKSFLKKFLNKTPKTGCDFLSIFPAHRHRDIKSSIAKALTGQSLEYEVFYPPDLWCLVNYTSVPDEDTDTKLICISARDITHRKKAEDELKIFSLLAKETQNGVMITDPQNRIMWVNEGFTRMNGYSSKEAIGKHPKFLFAGPETDVKTIALLEKNIAAGKHYHCELTSYHKNKSRIRMRLDMQPIFNENKELVKYFVIQTDLTEQYLQKEKEIANKIQLQKETNRLVLKTQEQITNELGRELHDNINQILTAAKLQLEIAQTDPQLCQSFVDKACRSVETVIQEIRTLSKQLTAPRFAEADLGTEIQNLLENLGLQYKTTVRTDKLNTEKLCPELKLHIFRILQEQLKNIIKYAGAQCIFIELENKATQLHVKIEDDGIGFDPNKKKNGIGLTNIRNRVESYNGTLKIDSATGNGCRMFIAVPTH